MTMVRSPTENWRTLPAGKSTIAALSMSRLRVTAVSPEPSQSRTISQKETSNFYRIFPLKFKSSFLRIALTLTVVAGLAVGLK